MALALVARGLYDIIKTKNLNLEIVKIAIKDANKQRSLPSRLFTTERDELLNNPEINTIVELINDTEAAAFEIVSSGPKLGQKCGICQQKNDRTAFERADRTAKHKHGTSLLYEGAVCGSIPIIRNLEEYYDNELHALHQRAYLTGHQTIYFRKALTKIWIMIPR